MTRIDAAERADGPMERLVDLVALEATEGLAPPDRDDLHDLLVEIGPEALEVHEELHLAAAASELALGYSRSDLPAQLEASLQEEARAWQPSSAAGRVVELHPQRGAQRATGGASHDTDTGIGGRPSHFGWWWAAAATVLAVVAWWPRPESIDSATEIGQTEVSWQQAAGSQGAHVDGFSTATVLEPLTGRATLPLVPSGDAWAEEARGTLTWDTEAQRGLLRLSGLAVNDPSEAQYQLWIFDKARDDAFPVDGGVFDITSPGEQEIEVGARLSVSEPAFFAITVERPGGVVVSKRDRVVLFARV